MFVRAVVGEPSRIHVSDAAATLGPLVLFAEHMHAVWLASLKSFSSASLGDTTIFYRTRTGTHSD